MGILFLLAIVGVVVFVLVKKGNAEPVSETSRLVLPTTETPKTPVTQVLSVSEELVETDDQEVVRIYLHEPENRVWCCANCQCENNYSDTNCRVCNYKR